MLKGILFKKQLLYWERFCLCKFSSVDVRKKTLYNYCMCVHQPKKPYLLYNYINIKKKFWWLNGICNKNLYRHLNNDVDHGYVNVVYHWICCCDDDLYPCHDHFADFVLFHVLFLVLIPVVLDVVFALLNVFDAKLLFQQSILILYKFCLITILSIFICGVKLTTNLFWC